MSAEKKISKFLGSLPSKQIFYRNVSLGAPEYTQTLLINEENVPHNNNKTICPFNKAIEKYVWNKL